MEYFFHTERNSFDKVLLYDAVPWLNRNSFAKIRSAEPYAGNYKTYISKNILIHFLIYD